MPRGLLIHSKLGSTLESTTSHGRTRETRQYVNYDTASNGSSLESLVHPTELGLVSDSNNGDGRQERTPRGQPSDVA